jgi:short-subunit dehydrogenase
MSNNSTFVERYGPWAIIAGASDGLGAELAREAARKGLNCVLVARRLNKLEELAEELRREYGVEALARPLDLMDADAPARLEAIADEVDVGLYVVNAGGDTVQTAFLESDMERWQSLIGRNVINLTSSLHRFGRRFVARGSGGMAVIGSDAALNGAGRLSIYSASKAYALNLIESIWAELKPHNVDAVFLVIGTTDTPKLRGLMTLRGVPPEEIVMGKPADIAAWALADLTQGPTLVFDVDNDDTDPLHGPAGRRRRVARNTRILDFFYGDPGVDIEAEGLKSGRSWK